MSKIKRRVALMLYRAGDRIQGVNRTGRPDHVMCGVPITDEGAKAIAAALDAEIGGKVGLGFTRPDGTSGITRY